jgi:hypothetical protein
MAYYWRKLMKCVGHFGQDPPKAGSFGFSMFYSKVFTVTEF